MNQWPLANVSYNDYDDVIEEIFDTLKDRYIPSWIDKDGTYEEIFFVKHLSPKEKLTLAVEVFVENRQWSIIYADLVKVPDDIQLAWTDTMADSYFGLGE